MEDSDYISAIRDRMTRGGYDTHTGALPPGAVILGHRAEFRWAWYATRLHLFVAVKQLRSATRNDLQDFTAETLAAGKRAKGRLRGLQNGVGAIAVLVADHVDTDAARFAETELVRQFAAFAWPVTVDLSTGQRVAHIGKPRIGHIYNSWMQEQLDGVIPAPSTNS